MLTEKQRECLEAMSRGGTAWTAFAPSTIHALRVAGLIRSKDRRPVLTDAGRAALAGSVK